MPRIPKEVDKQSHRISWSTILNAAEISRRLRRVISPWSAARTTSEMILRTAVSVDLLCRYTHCKLGRRLFFSRNAISWRHTSHLITVDKNFRLEIGLKFSGSVRSASDFFRQGVMSAWRWLLGKWLWVLQELHRLVMNGNSSWRNSLRVVVDSGSRLHDLEGQLQWPWRCHLLHSIIKDSDPFITSLNENLTMDMSLHKVSKGNVKILFNCKLKKMP